MSEPISAVVVLALLLGAILVLQRPLVAGRREAAVQADELRRGDLEAEKVAKYREIRDAELDRRTGKLSDADWRAVDRRLREDAVEILRRLDEVGPAPDPVAAVEPEAVSEAAEGRGAGAHESPVRESGPAARRRTA